MIDGSSMSAPVSMRLSSPRSTLCTSINSSASRCPGLSSFCTAEEHIHHIFSCPGLLPFCSAEEISSHLFLPRTLVVLRGKRTHSSHLFLPRALVLLRGGREFITSLPAQGSRPSAQQKKIHHVCSSQVRADQMPGPPWEGQLMCILFLSMRPSAQHKATFIVAQCGHLLHFRPYNTTHSHPYI